MTFFKSTFSPVRSYRRGSRRIYDAQSYSYTGSDQTITALSDMVKVYMWGAGGGQGGSSTSNCIGGVGGYSESTIILPSNISQIVLVVGSAGQTGQYTSSVYGGGGGGGADGGNSGGSGGGRSAIRLTDGTEIITAGGGGGGGYQSSIIGGAGGGLTGYGDGGIYGGGGTQTSGGSAGIGGIRSGSAGSQYQGGFGSVNGGGWGGGGGGGGWYGGGGGGGQNGIHGAGAGGSGWVGRNGSSILSGNEYGTSSSYEDLSLRLDSVTGIGYMNTKCLRGGSAPNGAVMTGMPLYNGSASKSSNNGQIVIQFI